MPANEFAFTSVQTNDIHVAQIFSAHNIALWVITGAEARTRDEVVDAYATAFVAAYKGIAAATGYSR